ncbi:ATP-binding protein [Pseudemcibacter aquimaris]|uniref:ATP-binding protein n=1 Tax=Pseudemcibacter aquimaris TaxID=2857064 RepID=UPI00201167E0|nr:ATP-binding protein [Pseudemcibacter aquimaris]MCC3860132.1 ATP-binding protein [Pseudemcibacter aquimaris]WDU57459.1 ATP-binding protein [Pseudemcibacter aquimaris]
MAEINDKTLNRIADALERLAPNDSVKPTLDGADAFVWHADPDRLDPIHNVSRVDFNLLQGIDHVRDILLKNTEQFANGYAANNALLWGARGMGKSSLVKALHAKVGNLALIEIHREDIPSLPRLLEIIRDSGRQCILFCDDLSFDHDDGNYKSLKAVLEGGIEGRPKNVIFYATSNRRHLMPRDMMENERGTAINPSEAIEEKVSLSDRFGLWLGFHSCNQDDYLKMIDGYLDHFGIKYDRDDAHAEALTWSRTRGARSGRVAFQFIQDLAGRMGVKL